MKKNIVNILATTGISLLLLSSIALSFRVNPKSRIIFTQIKKPFLHYK